MFTTGIARSVSATGKITDKLDELLQNQAGDEVSDDEVGDGSFEEEEDAASGDDDDDDDDDFSVPAPPAKPPTAGAKRPMMSGKQPRVTPQSTVHSMHLLAVEIAKELDGDTFNKAGFSKFLQDRQMITKRSVAGKPTFFARRGKEGTVLSQIIGPETWTSPPKFEKMKAHLSAFLTAVAKVPLLDYMEAKNLEGDGKDDFIVWLFRCVSTSPLNATKDYQGAFARRPIPKPKASHAKSATKDDDEECVEEEEEDEEGDDDEKEEDSEFLSSDDDSDFHAPVPTATTNKRKRPASDSGHPDERATKTFRPDDLIKEFDGLRDKYIGALVAAAASRQHSEEEFLVVQDRAAQAELALAQSEDRHKQATEEFLGIIQEQAAEIKKVQAQNEANKNALLSVKGILAQLGQ